MSKPISKLGRKTKEQDAQPTEVQQESTRDTTPVNDAPTEPAQEQDAPFEAEIKVVTSFEEMNLKDKLLRGIFSYGFEKPTVIQQRGILPILNGTDTIVQAQSGTGKTGTFTIAALQTIDHNIRATQALILAPTRELAQQIERVASGISEYLGTEIHTCIGGTNTRSDAQILRRGVHLVVGTPGRVVDMLGRQHLNLSQCKIFILDEADEMLSVEFQEQMKDIFKHLPKSVQIVLCSATMPREILDITELFMNNPQRILVKREELTLDGIKQYYVNVQEEKNKFLILTDLYESLTITQAIIFCNTRRKVDELAEQMTKEDHAVSCIHGEMTANDREQVLRLFRTGQTRVLIATDVLARGIDVQQVNLVINYDLPKNKENYIHRIGRSGRFGKKGTALNFVTDYDTRQLEDIERFYKTEIGELTEAVLNDI